MFISNSVFETGKNGTLSTEVGQTPVGNAWRDRLIPGSWGMELWHHPHLCHTPPAPVSLHIGEFVWILTFSIPLTIVSQIWGINESLSISSSADSSFITLKLHSYRSCRVLVLRWYRARLWDKGQDVTPGVSSGHLLSSRR